MHRPALLIALACVACAAEPTEAAKTAAALEACPVTAPPEQLYEAFSAFCRAHFGAEREPLLYERFGTNLAIATEDTWIHASATSAVIGFTTNLPATSVIEYGLTSTFTEHSTASDRPYATHIHHLRGLKEGATYSYRIKVTDERGNTLHGASAVFTTAAPAGSIAVPGDLAGPPYVLATSGATYRLTQDLVTPGMAIEVIGDHITLDLDGHTVRFGEGATEAVSAGIMVRGSETTAIRYHSTGVRILNGRIEQGMGTALAANATHERFCPLVIVGDSPEVAGLDIDYHGPQTWGLTFSKPTGALRLHHTVITDRGGIITNRHGSGSRAIGCVKQDKEANAFVMHHNLIRRARQNGMGGASSMHHNEVYLDSCSTNSFAIQPLSVPGVKAGEYHHNRIFGTGFNAYGFGWAHDDLTIRDNVIHFHGIMANNRWASVESWGDLSMLEGMRVTNYGKGGQVRNRLTYRDNLIVLRGGNGCELRGTGFFSDVSITDLIFENNTVKVIADDEKTTQVACIAAHGLPSKPDALPVIYRNNTLIGNVCLVRFGDSYGKGHNHDFIANTFMREGSRPDFHAVVFGGAFMTWGHDFIDNVIGENIDLANVGWERTGHTSHFTVHNTLSIQAPPGASVSIRDARNAVVFTGTGGADALVATLASQIVRPPTWEAKTEAKDLSGSTLEALTPHQVTITVDGKELTTNVDMGRSRILSVRGDTVTVTP